MLKRGVKKEESGQRKKLVKGYEILLPFTVYYGVDSTTLVQICLKYISILSLTGKLGHNLLKSHVEKNLGEISTRT